MPCAVAPIALAATLLSGPMCPRLDRPSAPTMDVLVAALRGDSRPTTASTDLAFEAAIRAIRIPESPKPTPSRRHRR